MKATRFGSIATLIVAANVACMIDFSLVSATSPHDGLRPGFTPNEAGKDLDHLDKWLVKKAKNNQDPKVDFELAMAKLAQEPAKQGSIWNKLAGKCANLSRPLRMLEQMAKVNLCDDDTLEVIRYVHLASGQVKGGSCERATKLLRHYAHEVSNHCSRYLDIKFNEMLVNVLQSNKWNLLMIRMEPNNKGLWASQPWKKAAFEWDLSKGNTSYVFNEDDMLRIMHALAKNDPRNQFVNRQPHERNGNHDHSGLESDLDYLYDLHLVRPCKHYHEAMKEFVETFYALQDYSALDDYYESNFVSERSYYTNLGVFRYKVCERVLDDADEIKAKLQFKINQDKTNRNQDNI